ncbi:hypothetical protein C8R47DRAFT_1217820 [Mycena vitilis]|nr:hypothetical protein C8R47DRAFT_1217820 [Mycena vitilis]
MCCCSYSVASLARSAFPFAYSFFHMCPGTPASFLPYFIPWLPALPFAPHSRANPASHILRSSPPDHTTFIATLYTTPSASARYADEPGAGLRELCVWRADVGGMGGFAEAAATHPQGGFYTDFDLALELDSAEVRGVLLDGRGGEWGRVVFAFT